MNLAINQLLKLFSLSIFCTALLFSAPVLSLDTNGDSVNSAQDANDANATTYDVCSLDKQRLLNMYTEVNEGDRPKTTKMNTCNTTEMGR